MTPSLPTMKPLRSLLTLLFLLPLLPAAAQSDRIEEQKRVIENLEKKIAAEEQQIASLKKGRAATEERARRLAGQIESRTRLLDETQKQARQLREAAAMRERKLQELRTLSERVQTEKEQLDARQQSLASVTKKLSSQKVELERDARNARVEIRRMSEKEKSALQRKMAQQQQLSVAIDQLRKLSKGNTAGASFSSRTSGLQLPVPAGRVKRYRENMAEITGPKGAQVVSIYEGKVVEIKRNRITDKFDVFIAHGEYITSYANLGSVCIEKGQKVAKNQRIGTVGSAIDALTMQIEYRIVFGIYPPNPSQKLLAENCFKKK